MKSKIGGIRNSYSGDHLDPTNVSGNPIHQFHTWFQEVINANVTEPTAMTLATVSDGMPSARIVLLKDYNKNGFTFYTNYLSQKAKEIENNPNAALLFFCPQLSRQIRIRGRLDKRPYSVSADYFNTRPEGSKVSAWVSPQSSVIENRASLENKYADFEKEHKQKNIVCPNFWGGYLLTPIEFEFWQGQADRLHDRVQYIFEKENKWIINRLAP